MARQVAGHAGPSTAARHGRRGAAGKEEGRGAPHVPYFSD